MKDLGTVDQVTSLQESNCLLAEVSGSIRRISFSDMRSHLNDDEQMVLSELAFYIDVNKLSSKGAQYVDTGGNMEAFDSWASNFKSALMDKNGNYCLLNPNDGRYTEDGDAVVSDGAVVSAYQNADWMVVYEGGGGLRGWWEYAQTVTQGSTSWVRLWVAPVQIPGGTFVEFAPVGKYKSYVSSSALRSIPFVNPNGRITINQFYSYAQARSKNHGLAGDPWHEMLLIYMMGKYGFRDVQNLKSSDGTLVFGPGLDGTENTTGSSKSGWERQQSIKTGACLALGDGDGKTAVEDSEGGTCHSVTMHGFENPYGQYWEMDGHLASVGTTVYGWDHNFLPSAAPTADTFASVKHREMTRCSSGVSDSITLNLIATSGEVHLSYIASKTGGEGSYGDRQTPDFTNGQLHLAGGRSVNGENCGLAGSASNGEWSQVLPDITARLDYHGSVNKVTSTQLKALLAS